jgi:hypothetical protein
MIHRAIFLQNMLNSLFSRYSISQQDFFSPPNPFNQFEMQWLADSKWKFKPNVKLTTFETYMARGHLKKRCLIVSLHPQKRQLFSHSSPL